MTVLSTSSVSFVAITAVFVVTVRMLVSTGRAKGQRRVMGAGKSRQVPFSYEEACRRSEYRYTLSLTSNHNSLIHPLLYVGGPYKSYTYSYQRTCPCTWSVLIFHIMILWFIVGLTEYLSHTIVVYNTSSLMPPSLSVVYFTKYPIIISSGIISFSLSLCSWSPSPGSYWGDVQAIVRDNGVPPTEHLFQGHSGWHRSFQISWGIMGAVNSRCCSYYKDGRGT